MQANNTIQKNRVYAPILLGVVLLLVTIVLYPLYVNYVDTSVTIASLEKNKSQKKLQVEAIKEMQALFAGSGSSELKTKVSKYNRPFNTSDIMEVVMLNKYTKSSALTPPSVSIGSISVDAGKKLPSGLSLATVSLQISADNPKQIVEYLSYLTMESPFAFTIDNISLPLDTAVTAQFATALSLNISLGVYYFQ